MFKIADVFLSQMALSRCINVCVIICTMFLTSCRTPDFDSPRKNSDAIVLLAGSYRERAPVAGALYHAGYAKVIILTNDGVGGGWSTKYGRNLTLIEWTEEELIALGIPRSSIVKLPFYKCGTIYDAMAVKRYAQSKGIKRLIIVTSGYHAKRALWCFRRLSRDDSMKVSLFSSIGSGNDSFYNVISELLKHCWYALKYDTLNIEPTE